MAGSPGFAGGMAVMTSTDLIPADAREHRPARWYISGLRNKPNV